jgi:rhamnosyltransferase
MAGVATVTVTFNPDVAVLMEQLESLPSAALKVVIDNGSDPTISSAVSNLASKLANVVFVGNQNNMGLGTAINQGVDTVLRVAPQTEFVLLLDQDSQPQRESVESLLEAFHQLESMGCAVGCVGPVLLDTATGFTHGFHQRTRWRWKRVYPHIGSTGLVPCANLNGSGTLVRVSLFQSLGGLDERLFIDHLDTDWSFRITASRHELWGVPRAVFVHKMGNESRRFWFFGWHLWPMRSPQRHYYLFRNTVLLMRRSYVPFVWKFWASVKLLVTCVMTLVLNPPRGAQLERMWRGLRHGVSLKTGR